MGYTHCWENKANAIPVEAILIIREIVDQAYAGGVIQVEHNRKGLPIVTERLIRFNGVGELWHETFRSMSMTTIARTKITISPFARRIRNHMTSS